MELILWKQKFDIEFNDSDLAKKIITKISFKQEINGRYWDEIYTLTDFWFELDNKAKEVMEIWDIAYWVKSDWTKEALVVFFCNTPEWDWTKPRPVSKCSVIWRITSDFENHSKIWKWEDFILW